MSLRVLILGGTTEASALARMLAHETRFAPTLSFAGRTKAPHAPDIPYRIGGFGGADALARWLVDERVAAIIDATHPYAARISANAVEASRTTGVPLASIVRAAWTRKPGDSWIDVTSAEHAAAATGRVSRRVFLSLGRLELSAFAAAPQHHYLARTIDPVGEMLLPPHVTLISGRGPFTFADEAALLKAHKVEIVVSKNSGGGATYAKIAAARTLGLQVIMIGRPNKPSGVRLADAAAAVVWLEARVASHGSSRSERGV